MSESDTQPPATNTEEEPGPRPLPEYEAPTNVPGNILNISNAVLGSLKVALEFTSVPFVAEAAGIVCSVLEICERAHQILQSCQHLVEEACGLTYLVYTHFDELSNSGKNPIEMNPRLERQLRSMVESLNLVKQECLRLSKQGWVQRVFKYGDNKDTIETLRHRLNTSTSIFHVESFIDIRTALDRMLKEVETRQANITQVKTTNITLNANENARFNAIGQTVTATNCGNTSTVVYNYVNGVFQTSARDGVREIEEIA
ncbi:unnamed protein product [Cyclocybe aegerita]|uniref:Uncharacterized protein n=1 Tax=Cyclocybe aegerita TaxID=1973307 RepID=A0A8S0WJF0_CYCAE|nr:unnamed protein product [Cyclocybe aegerita]